MDSACTTRPAMSNMDWARYWGSVIFPTELMTLPTLREMQGDASRAGCWF